MEEASKRGEGSAEICSSPAVSKYIIICIYIIITSRIFNKLEFSNSYCIILFVINKKGPSHRLVFI